MTRRGRRRNAAEWDAQTAATWIEANVAPSARPLMELAIQAVFSAEPRDLSLLHVLFYIHSAGGLRDLLGVTGAAQESRFVGGSQQIAQRMARDLGERVILSAPVTGIAWSADGVRVTSDAGVVEARGRSSLFRRHWRAASAMHPLFRDTATSLHSACRWERSSRSVMRLSRRLLAPRRPDRAGLQRYRRDPHHLRHLARRRRARHSRGLYRRRRGPPLGPRHAGRAARGGVGLSLTSYFGEQAATPLRYVEQAWAEEEWSRGCYAGYMPRRRLDHLRRGAARAHRPAPLGRNRDRDRVDGLHGGRGPVRRAGGG